MNSRSDTKEKITELKNYNRNEPKWTTERKRLEKQNSISEPWDSVKKLNIYVPGVSTEMRKKWVHKNVGRNNDWKYSKFDEKFKLTDPSRNNMQKHTHMQTHTPQIIKL